MKNFSQHQRYFFVFAHPDDEIYSCITIRNLIRAGKDVCLLYVTNGDYAGEEIGRQREGELERAHKVIGVNKEKVGLLGVSERQLMARARDVANAICQEVEAFAPDVIIGHDYEGGHDGHDLVSLCAWQAAKKLKINYWVFPAYYGQPAVRVWNTFVNNHTPDFEYSLGEREIALKRAVFACHASQARYFDDIEKSGGMAPLLSREILRRGEGNDYTKPPTDPVGYEFPGSPATYRFFTNAVTLSRSNDTYNM